jgi:hypothetical protein
MKQVLVKNNLMKNKLSFKMKQSKNVLNPASSEQSPKNKSEKNNFHLAMNIMKKCDTNLDD